MTGSSIKRKRALLDDAIAACTGDRHLSYGKPEANFRRIATLWSAWREIGKPGPIEPWEVAGFMILLKLARLAPTPDHRDSWLDIAGYAACGADVADGRDDEAPSVEERQP
jgi:Domain of unknown function (DUF6378)